MSVRAERWAAYALILIAWTLVFLPIFDSRSVLFFRDHSLLFARQLHATVDAYAQLRFPLWDPAAGGGEPLFAYPSSMAWTPLLLVFLLPGDFYFLYDLFVAAHILVALLGFIVLARALRCGVVASSIGALAFGLSGPIVALNSLLPTMSAAVFGPLALGLAIRVWQRPSAFVVAIAAPLVALHVQYADMHFVLADVVLFLVAAAPELRVRDRRANGYAFGALAGVAVLAVLASAIQVFPLLELLRSTPRGHGFDYEEIAGFSIHPLRLLEMFFPGITGDFSTGRVIFSDVNPGFDISSIYVGASVFALCAIGASMKPARKWLATAGSFLLLALGRYTPLHLLLVRTVPFFQTSRHPDKFMYGFVICWALAAASTVESLSIDRSRVRRATDLLAPLLIIIAGIALIAVDPRWASHAPHGAVTTDDVTAWFAGSTAHAMMFVVASSALLWAWLREKAPPMICARGLALVIALDLIIAARPLIVVTDKKLYDRPPVADLVLHDSPAPVAFLYQWLRAPDLARPTAAQLTLHGFSRLETGIGPLLGVHYVLDPEVNGIRPPFWYAVADEFGRLATESQRITFLARLGVTHILVEASTRDIPGLDFVGTATVVYGPPISVFRLREARAPLSIANRARIEPDLDSALRAMSSTTSLDLAILDRPAVAPEAEESLRSLGAGRAARISEVLTSAGRAAATIDAEAPVLLVWTQRFDAGWAARIDGAPASPMRVEAMLTGIVAPKGRHRIEIEYAPRSFRVGAVCTVVSYIACVLFILLSCYARR